MAMTIVAIVAMLSGVCLVLWLTPQSVSRMIRRDNLDHRTGEALEHYYVKVRHPEDGDIVLGFTEGQYFDMVKVATDSSEDWEGDL